MFHKTTKYQFNQGSHYIVTDQTLSPEELQQLSQLLCSFPHGNKSRYWPDKFAALNTEKVPKKLIYLAANAYDAIGNTMLGVAAEYGKSVETVQRLIDMGADLNAPDHDMKKLALHWAICNKLSYYDKTSDEAAKVVKCLLDNGARTDITCYEGCTPLQYAKSRGFVAAAKLIEEAIAKSYSENPGDSSPSQLIFKVKLRF